MRGDDSKARKMIMSWCQESSKYSRLIQRVPHLIDRLTAQTLSCPKKQILNSLESLSKSEPPWKSVQGVDREIKSQPVVTGTESGQQKSRSFRFPRKREGDLIYQCRYCYRGYKWPESWKIHEEKGCRPPEGGYICLKRELFLRRNNGRKCPFCRAADSSDRHMNDFHNYYACLGRIEEERTFATVEALQNHFKDVHHANVIMMPGSWKTPIGDPDRSRWCGFCEKNVGNLRESNLHIVNHFRDTEQVFDMTRWQGGPDGPGYGDSRYDDSRRDDSENDDSGHDDSEHDGPGHDGSDHDDSEHDGSRHGDSRHEISGHAESRHDDSKYDRPEHDDSGRDGSEHDAQRLNIQHLEQRPHVPYRRPLPVLEPKVQLPGPQTGSESFEWKSIFFRQFGSVDKSGCDRLTDHRMNNGRKVSEVG